MKLYNYKNMMEYSHLLFVGTLAFIVLLIPIYWGIHKAKSDSIGRVVSYTTILTGVTSAVVGLVSVFVMVDQRDMQKRLIEVQEMEHQPIFIAKRDLYQSDTTSDEYDYEEYSIINVGERAKNIRIVTKTFVKVYYKDYKRKIISCIPLRDYYQEHIATGELRGVIQYSKYSDLNKNFAHICDMRIQSMEYSSEMEFKSYIDIEVVYFFVIFYKDIYGEDRTVYLRDSTIVTREEFEALEKQSLSDYSGRLYDLSELSIDVFFEDYLQFKVEKLQLSVWANTPFWAASPSVLKFISALAETTSFPSRMSCD